MKESFPTKEMTTNDEKGESSINAIERALDEAAFNMASMRTAPAPQLTFPLVATNVSQNSSPRNPMTKTQCSSTSNVRHQ
jgi:hypothetical protein